MHELNNYQRIKIQTATPAQLINMLYDGAIKFMNLAILSMEKEEIEATNNSLTRAQRIIAELQISLDMEKGGQIAANLNSIYDYIYRQLVEANTKNNVEKIQECLALIMEIKDAWVQIMQKTTPVMPQATPPPVSTAISGGSLDIAC
jgi:flagellar protein FliS